MSESSVPFRHPWPERMFGEVGSVTVGGTPSTSVPEYWGGAIPWMASGDVHGRVIDDVPTRISGLGLRHSSAMVVDPPSIAVALAGQGRTRGTAAYIRCALCTNQSVALLKGNPGELDTEYLLHNLSFRYSELRSRSAGGGRAGLTKTILEQLPLPLPAVPEQAKIAEVLSTMDRAIEETEALIAKQQRIKAGLMQDLLTRGIDEHGNLRSEMSHEFKDSPLGRIPAEWDAAGLSTRKHAKKPYLKTGPFGSSLKISDWVEHGIPVITIGALGEGSFEEGDLLYISMAKAEQLAAYALEPGDIVFSRVADVGRSVVVTERERDWIMSSNMMRISIDVAKADPNFLRLNIVKHPGVRAQIRQTVNASGREVANQQVLDALRFPWPSVDEQRRIVRTVAQQSEQIVRKEACLAKFRRAKAGLMQDLLTGNRRVTALLEQREGATA